MADDRSDDYKKAERLVALADRAFPNMERAPTDPLARAVDLSEPSPAEALVPARAAETARLASEIVFDDDDEPAPAPPPRAADAVLDAEVIASLETMVSAPSPAPLAVSLRAPRAVPARDPSSSDAYLAGLDVQLVEAERVSPTAKAWGWGLIGGVVAAGAIAEGVVAAHHEREAREQALIEALEAESDEQRARMAQLAEQMGGIDKKVEAVRDATLKNAQLTAELAIVTQRKDAEGEPEEADATPAGEVDRDVPAPDPAAAAARRRRRLVRSGQMIEIAPEAAPAEPERNAVAAAIDKVLASGGGKSDT
jgi:hypothetical protein